MGQSKDKKTPERVVPTNVFDFLEGMFEAKKEKGGLFLEVWHYIRDHPDEDLPEVIDHFTLEEIARLEKLKYGKR
jgi:hypothetical protein